jgi:para-nitrobenzyl esterase
MKVTRRLWPLLGAGLAAIVLGACGGGGGDAPTVRSTTYGKVEGTADAASGTLSWKGVPFAQPPVGELRWKAPLEPQAWSGVRQATAFGNPCLQNGRIYGPGANNTYDSTIASTLNTPVGSEDCLTLNIWRPQGDAKDLPVIVWVFGGSNISGYTADPVYDGAALAKAANAVVVSTNYRVGPLGFFNLAQLKSGGNAAEDSGNFALLDILQALKFVQGNIGRFGGNPANVTLMGQSAGAINVWALMAAPSAAGLFHKAVPLSGGISTAGNLPPGSIPALNPPAVYAAQANALLARLLIADGQAADMTEAQAVIAGMSAAEVADYMRGKEGGTLLSTLLVNGLTGSGPIPDGSFLPANPINEIAAGNYNRMPVLAGTTAEEGKLFAPFLTLFGGPPGFLMSDAERFTLMKDYNPDAPAATAIEEVIHGDYLPADTPVTGWNARTALIGNALFGANRDNVLNTLVTQQDKVWYYQFKWAQQPAPWNTIYGAAHAFDLPFIFGNFGPSLFAGVTNSTANRSGRLALSAAMMASLGAFARSGDPNHAALGTTWQPWPGRLVFDATPTQAVITTE